MKKLLSVALLAALAFPAVALAHANVSPPVALAKHDQLFTLVVPKEKASPTVKVELDVPSGFSIDSFLDTPGWTRVTSQTTSGHLTSVTWTGSATGDVAFSFVGGSDSTGSRALVVKQTYGDGSVVSWSGSESSDTPAPVVQFESSLGGGTSTVSWIALVLGAVALVVAIGAVAARGGRSLA